MRMISGGQRKLSASMRQGALACILLAGACGRGVVPNESSPCDSDPCEPPGECVVDGNQARCQCPSGFEKDPNDASSCRNVDECALGTDTCDANATCTDTDGSYSCACKPGFIGDGSSCTPDCTIDANLCDPHATCTNVGGANQCVCDSGYSGDGTACTNIDECALGTATCHADASCTDTDGGYTCACKAGFVGDGFTCVADCSGNPSACDPHATCTNVGGSNQCVCDTGYEGDGASCVDIDGCAGSPCFANVTCTDVLAPGTGFTCGNCPSGYDGDGITCTDTNGCASAPCYPTVTCTDVPAPGTGYTCGNCPTGYSGDGETCTDDNECLGEGTGNNCVWPEVCSNTVGSYLCVCDTITNPTLTDPGNACGSGPPDVTTTWTPVVGETYAVEFFDGTSWGPVDEQLSDSATQFGVAVGSGYRFRISTTVDTCTSASYQETAPFEVIAPPLAPTTLISPDVCEGATPQLTFSGEQDAISEDVDVVGPDAANYSYLSVTSPVDATSLNGAVGLYTWSVTSAGNAPCGTDVSNSETFQILPLPILPTSLTTPSGCAATPIELGWSFGQAYGNYLVEVDYGSGFTSTGLSSITSATADLTTGNTGTFAWRVTHETTSCGSAVAASSTVNVYPRPVRPTSPVATEGCAGVLGADLSWSLGQTDGSYLVQVDYGAGWVTTGIGSVTSSGAVLSTSNSGIFAWQVQHVSSNCGASAVASGSVTMTAPPSPNPIPLADLSSPAGGTEPYADTLSWVDTVPVPADGYEVELMTGSCGGATVEGWPQTTSANTLATGWLHAGTYYWRVTPLANGACPTGTPSACASFVVDPVAVAWHPRGDSEYGPWTTRIEGSASGGGFTQSAAAINYVRVAVDASDHLVVAWVGEGSQVFLRRWNGSLWEELDGSGSGGGVSNGAAQCVFPTLALDSAGNPNVAWSAGNEIYFERWNGSSWEELAGSGSGGGVSNNATYSYYPSLALDSSDNPVLAWSDGSSTLAGKDIYVRRWNGSSWAELASSATAGGISNCTSTCRHPEVVIDSSDNPVVAWVYSNRGIMLRVWSGTSWDALDTSATEPVGLCSICDGTSVTVLGHGGSLPVQSPGLRLDSSDQPVVTWSAYKSGMGADVYLEAWDGSAWAGIGGSETGTAINTHAGNAYTPRLVLDSSDNPIVAWEQNYMGIGAATISEIVLKQWTGSAWAEMAGSQSNGGVSNNRGTSMLPRIELLGGGDPVVAWVDGTEANYNTDGYVRRLNGSSWDEVNATHTGGGISATTESSITPVLAANASATLFVTWEENLGQDAYIFARTFDGASWVEMDGSGSGGGITNDIFPSRRPAMAIDPTNGYPVIVWNQDTLDDEIYLQRWDGAAWVGLGGSDTGGGVSNSKYADNPAVGVFSTGYPVVTWSDISTREVYIRRWTGSSWSTTVNISANSGNSWYPQLAMDQNDQALVAWQDQSNGGNWEIYFKRGASFMTALGGSASGGGVSNTAGASQYPAVIADGAGNPTVVWSDTDNGNYEIYLRTWTGTTWAELGGSATAGGISATAAASLNPALGIDSRGRLVVAWQEATSDASYEIYLRRLENNVWVELDGSAQGGGISNSGASSYNPSVTAAGGRICVAWEEANESAPQVMLRCHVE